MSGGSGLTTLFVVCYDINRRLKLEDDGRMWIGRCGGGDPRFGRDPRRPRSSGSRMMLKTSWLTTYVKHWPMVLSFRLFFA